MSEWTKAQGMDSFESANTRCHNISDIRSPKKSNGIWDENAWTLDTGQCLYLKCRCIGV